MHFKDKVALVTGGASGIGKEAALRFARHGAKVAIFDINQQTLETTHEELKKVTGDAIAILGDASQKDDVEACVEKAIERFGTVDYLINCAGILRDGLIAKISEADFDAVIATNLKGVFLFTQACVKAWTKAPLERIKAAKAEGKPVPTPSEFPDRRIVTISSMAAEGNIGQVAYAASKAGVLGITRTAAKELIQYNIKAHAVQPTLIDTPIIGDLLTKEDGKWKRFYEGRIPLGIGKPGHVADAILWLCSEESCFMTGNVLQLNGGKLGEL
ncbi:MAG: SDR family oxidoreductase [Candidatus Lokiarchaeota archaeon]|nr:SDR family oxidoreductase [Candidatus Lokiarchaeota archaeon]